MNMRACTCVCLQVDKVMQPRVDVVALPVHASAREILHTAVISKYSRIPIYKYAHMLICMYTHTGRYICTHAFVLT